MWRKWVIVFGLLWMSVALHGQQVGDLYTFPDSTQGVVFYLLPDGSGGWVVALEDFPYPCNLGLSVTYSDFIAMNPLALNYRADTAGYKNTQFLYQMNFQGNVFAVNMVGFEHGWYIPAAAQLSRLYSQIPYIESTLTTYGNPLLEGRYWSSTMSSSDLAYIMYFGSEDSPLWGFYSGSFGTYFACGDVSLGAIRFRPVRSFRYPSVYVDTTLTYQWNTGSTQPMISPSPTQTTTYTVTATNEMGCSASASQTVFVAQNAPQDFYDEVCQGEPYEDNGFTLTAAETDAPGQLIRTRTVTADGCSSTVTLHLTVRSAPVTDLDVDGCQTYVWNGVTYYESGIYEQHFPSASGCDSTVFLHLTLHQPDTTLLTASDCDSYSLNGITYSYSGEYFQHFTNVLGCDSVVVLNLTIHRPQQVTVDTSAYDGLVWDSTLYTESGTYTLTYQNQYGCDSIVTLNVTILHLDTVFVDSTVCDNALPFVWNGVTFNGVGTQDVILPSYLGYDSVVVMTLHVNPAQQTQFAVTTCDSYMWNGQTYTQSGNYTQELVNQQGCDSIVTVHLTVHSSHQTNLALTVCDSYTWNGQTYTQSGSYTQEFVSQQGCDSTVTLALTVNPSCETSFDTTVCNAFLWNEQTYTETGSYVQHLTNVYGCDSVVTANLTVHSSDTVALDTLVCPQSLPLTVRGFTFTGAGTQTVTLPNVHGCDSTSTVHLEVSDTTTVVTAQTACNSYYWYGTVYTESGVYYHPATNPDGCPYTRRLDLTVHYSDTTHLDSTVCQNDLPLIWNGRVFNAAGTQSRPFTTHHGCDSIVVMTVQVIPSSFSSFDTTVCGQFEWRGSVYTQSGTFMKPFVGASGCDSLVFAHVTVMQPSVTLFDTTVCADELPLTWHGHLFENPDTLTFTYTSVWDCDSTVEIRLRTATADTVVLSVSACDVFEWDGDEYYESDTLTQYYLNCYGCDSVVTVCLTVHHSQTSQFADTVCGTYLWAGETFTQSGTYIRTFSTVEGCDSAVTLQLTLLDTYQTTEERTICEDSLPYVWNGLTFIGADTKVCTLQTIDGCDSVVTMTLHVSNTYQLTEERTICEDSLPYVWNGLTFNGADTKDCTLQTVDGCDSVVTMTLHVSNIYQLAEERTICEDSLPYVWNGMTFSGAGTKVCTLQTVDGCDSIVTMTLHVSNTYQLTEERTICEDSLPYVWNGMTFDGADTKICTLQTVDDCDSVVTMTLHISNTYQLTQERTICEDSLPYIWNGFTFTGADTQSVTLQTLDGCDSVVTMVLHVFNTYQQTEQRTVCQNELPYIWNGVTFNGASSQVSTLQTANGCDSVVTMTLLVANTYQQTEQRSICQNELPYLWNGVTFSNAGTQPVTLQTVDGCDSVVTMTLQVFNTFQQTEQRTICQDELPYVWNGVTFNNAGTQSVTLQTVHGCDSVVMMTLHVSNTYQLTEQRTVCQDELPYVWNGKTFNAAGTQSVTLQTVNGCDSIVTMTLHVSNVYQQTENRTVCANELPYVWNGVTFTGADTQSVALQTMAGCDSVVTMVLSVADTSHSDWQEHACDEYQWNDSTYYESGDYTQLLTNLAGCDSVVTLHLTVSYSGQYQFDVESCGDYRWQDEVYSESGDYERLLTNAAGCDSVVTLHLTVIDTALQIITLTEDFCEGMSAELVAVTAMTDYLWSTGEELPNITVTQPGLYSVTASQGGCRATAKYRVEPCDFRLWLPNVITPSKSDGLNDVFCLPQRVQSMINDFEISIFNRWGEQVFYSTDKAFRWDGSVDGKTSVSTVYNYVIRCTVAGGKPYRFTGSVTVL
ncbi:MAG: gliding motility-associated C-terminal domain-containing protein [Bacteroidales bacterium]|nr:gliding motility-associated C-terminal domain-containing protein [Bacteroidales bacterium]